MTFDEALDYGTLTRGVLQHNDQLIPYRTVLQMLRPNYPFFAGLHGKELFISERVPLIWRERILRHEATCNLDHKGEVGRCLATTKEELVGLPEAEIKSYTAIRVVFYDSLLADASLTDEAFRAEITASRDYLKAVLDGTLP